MWKRMVTGGDTGAGLLADERFERLDAAGIPWEPFRSAEDDEWDELVALLLVEARLERQAGPEGEVVPPVSLPARLARRLEEACTAWQAGRLPASHVAQLQALGWSPYGPCTQPAAQRAPSHASGPPRV